MIYKASLDLTAIIITAVITIIFGSFLIFKPTIFAGFLFLMIYLLCLALKPIYYQISEKELMIKRLIKNVRISRSEIESLELIDKKAISGSIRTFGIGGLFGYIGKFSNFELGNMTWYVTRRDQPVLLKMKGGQKIILSPDDSEDFVAKFNAV